MKIKSKADHDDTIFVTYALSKILAADGMELCVMYILPSSETKSAHYRNTNLASSNNTEALSDPG